MAAAALPVLAERLVAHAPAEATVILDLIADVQPVAEPTPRPLLDAIHRGVLQLLRKADADTGLALRRAFVRVLVRSQAHRLTTETAIVAAIEANAALHREFAAEMAGVLAARGEYVAGTLPTLQDVLEREPEPIGGGKHSAFGERFTVRDRLLMKTARAIEQISGRSLDHVHAHRYWLRYGDAAARLRAARSLAIVARPATSHHVVAALIAALDDPDRGVVGEAVTALGLLGARAREALPHLEQFARRGDRQIARRARAAIRQIGQPEAQRSGGR